MLNLKDILYEFEQDPCWKISNFDVDEKLKIRREKNALAVKRCYEKKKNEKKQLFAECNEYKKKISNLEEDIKNIKFEISFIKNLLLDVINKF